MACHDERRYPERPRSVALGDLFDEFRARGDEAAFAAVFEQVAPALWRIAWRITGDRFSADDVVQDTFVVALERAARFDSRRSLAKWLAGIARHKALRVAHGGDRREPIAEPAAPEHEAPLRVCERGEQRRLIRDAIAGLPPIYAAALEMRLLHGLSTAEVARRLELPEGTVRARLTRGVRELRRRLPRALVPVLFALWLAPAGRAASPRRRSSPPVAAAAGVAAVLVLTSVRWTPATPAPPALAGAPVEAAAARGAAEATAQRRVPLASITHADHGRGALHLLVRWHGGDPADGVGVKLLRSGADSGFGAARAVTGPDGVARFEDLGSGLHELHIDRGVTAAIRVDAGGVVRREFVLPAGTTVRGRVQLPAGQPVAGVAIWVCDAPHFPLAAQAVTVTDSRGRFTLRDVPPGGCLFARGGGHAASALFQIHDRAAQDEVVLELGPAAGSVVGRVVDWAGRAIADAEVTVGDDARTHRHLPHGLATWRNPPQVVPTDAGGGFAVHDVRPGWRPVLVRAPGLAPACTHVRVAPGATSEVSVVAERGVEWSGRITGPESAPLTGALLAIDGGALYQRASAVTDEDGRFRLRCLAPGTFRLSVSHAGYTALAQTIVLVAGTATDRVLRLERDAQAPSPEVRPAAIDGALVSADALPGDLWVRASGASGAGAAARVAPGGTFEIAGLPPGSYRLAVESGEPGFAPLWLGEHELSAAGAVHLGEVRLTRPGWLRYDFRRHDGAAIERLGVVLLDGEGRLITPLRNGGAASGTLPVRPGRYRVSVYGEHELWLEGLPIAIESGVETVLERQLEPGCRVHVIAALPERVAPGTPVAVAGVPCTVDARGCVEVHPMLRPGRAHLSARLPDGEVLGATLEVPERTSYEVVHVAFAAR